MGQGGDVLVPGQPYGPLLKAVNSVRDIGSGRSSRACIGPSVTPCALLYENTPEAGRWKPALIGLGIGFLLGFGIGLAKDDLDALLKPDSLENLPTAPGDPGPCSERG